MDIFGMSKIENPRYSCWKRCFLESFRA
jgi:hypothetical protein